MERVGEVDPVPKKKPKLGRLSDVKKQLLKQSHEVGPNCHCSRLKCFDVLSDSDRKVIINKFNSMTDYNEQNLYLGGLITSSLVKQRRPRNDQPASHAYSYSYKVRLIKDEKLLETPICYKAFLSVHGITARRVQTLQSMLMKNGEISKDARGGHSNRPHKLKDDTVHNIHKHIKSLKGRRSHYSRHDSKKIYLPDTLDIKKLYNLYKEAYPNYPVSYDSYRYIFNHHYNIGFGYPRTDTCSTCDEFKARVHDLELKIHNNSGDSGSLQAELKKINIEHDIHLRKAESFYERKRTARKAAQKSTEIEAICMDYQKNLSVPNISTNNVYYKRQLSFYLFNIHTLSTQESVFYSYDESVGKKGSDEVTSMLYDFICNFLKPEVRHLIVFCDSCAGQNKNFTLFRFAYFLVHIIGRLDSFKMVFPIRGHSYMECDRNMGLINTKSYTEVPDDWISIIANARVKPSPFLVVKCDQSIFQGWTSFFQKTNFQQKCPFKSRPVREMEVNVSKPTLILVRDSYNGAFLSICMTQSTKQPKKKATDKRNLILMERGMLLRPHSLYNGKIPISKAKFNDLQDLKRFLPQTAQNFYDNLTFKDGKEEDGGEEIIG